MTLNQTSLVVTVALILSGCSSDFTDEQADRLNGQSGFVIEPFIENDEGGMLIDPCSSNFPRVRSVCNKDQDGGEVWAGSHSARVFRLSEDRR